MAEDLRCHRFGANWSLPLQNLLGSESIGILFGAKAAMILEYFPPSAFYQQTRLFKRGNPSFKKLFAGENGLTNTSFELEVALNSCLRFVSLSCLSIVFAKRT